MVQAKSRAIAYQSQIEAIAPRPRKLKADASELPPIPIGPTSLQILLDKARSLLASPLKIQNHPPRSPNSTPLREKHMFHFTVKLRLL
jgi:hypothetical protein